MRWDAISAMCMAGTRGLTSAPQAPGWSEWLLDRREHSHALIMEDDACFDDHALNHLWPLVLQPLLEAMPPLWDVLLLGYFEVVGAEKIQVMHGTVGFSCMFRCRTCRSTRCNRGRAVFLGPILRDSLEQGLPAARLSHQPAGGRLATSVCVSH